MIIDLYMGLWQHAIELVSASLQVCVVRQVRKVGEVVPPLIALVSMKLGTVLISHRLENLHA